jgi:serine/threonine protein kinase
MNREAELLFHELADLSPAERETLIRERALSPQLRVEVEQLLRFDCEADDSITGWVAASADELLNASAKTQANRRCGPYQLIRLLGRGGMGLVYLAERADGEVEQQVAIKFLRYAGEEPSFQDRFLRERQILATLNHPGIARLLDAGRRDDGPYLVMDYIDGIPIDVYAERLDLRGKLGLFLKVCDAISYAHRNLIIHRDIKPSNILVEESGQPRLLDFGIAKILDASLDQTRTQEGLLTPKYASPEQIQGKAQAVTSDIYSLGAVLYTLLTGQAPHADASARSLNAAIPKDLDFIIRKTLRKEPEERYGSVDALADDIHAFLELRPVRARSGNAWYRTRKLLRRYWPQAIAATVVMAILAGGLYIANRERAIAQRRFSDVRQLANKLFDIDASVRDLPASTSTRQLIVDTALDYLRRLKDDARQDPELALEVGNAYMRVARVQGVPISPTLGQVDQAEQNLQTAQALIDAVIKAQPANRTAMLRLAQIAHDRMILASFRGRNDEALRLAETSAQWLEKFHAIAGDKSEATAVLTAYLNVAGQFKSAQRFNEALQLSRRASDLAAAYDRPASRGTFYWVSAQVLQQRGELEQALKDIDASVSLLDPGPNLLGKGGQARNFQLALVYKARILGDDSWVSLGRYAEALKPLQRAFQIGDDFVHRDLKDHNSRGGLAMAGIAMGDILRHSDAPAALEVYDHTLRHLAETPGDTHLERYEATLLAGSVYPLLQMGRNAEARQRLDRLFDRLNKLKLYPAAKIFPGSQAEDALQALAAWEAARGNLPGAIEVSKKLLAEIQPAKSGLQPDLEDALHLTSAYSSAAELYRRAGNEGEARTLDAAQRELWRQWDRKLPNNSFVMRRLAALDAS